jgi:16S rRNA processing protein RimM
LPNAAPITLAVIIGAHGVMGEVRLKLFCEDVDSLKAHKSFNGGTLTLTSLRPGNSIIARFAQIPDRNGAEAARGTELTVPREALPPLAEGEYYHADVIGLLFESDAGEVLGHCVAVENFGAGDIVEIERPSGKRFMAPMTAATVFRDRGLLQAAFVEPDPVTPANRPARLPKSPPK